jgi:hypothetical protein
MPSDADLAGNDGRVILKCEKNKKTVNRKERVINMSENVT